MKGSILLSPPSVAARGCTYTQPREHAALLGIAGRSVAGYPLQGKTRVRFPFGEVGYTSFALVAQW
jgi:hypothetical protein